MTTPIALSRPAAAAVFVASLVLGGCAAQPSEPPAENTDATSTPAVAEAAPPAEPVPTADTAPATADSAPTTTAAPSADAPAAETPAAAAPPPFVPTRLGLALAVSARSGGETGAAATTTDDTGMAAASEPAGTQVEWRRWSLGRVELRGPWSPVVATGDEALAPAVYEFRTGIAGWVRLSAEGFGAVRVNELTRARLSQLRLTDDEPGRLVIDLTRGSVNIRPHTDTKTGAARSVLVKTPAGDVAVREPVEVAYDAAAGVRTRLLQGE